MRHSRPLRSIIRFSPRAFTLVELLVVIAIIGVLAGITIPVMSSVKRNARQTRSIGNLHAIYLGLMNYAISHRNLLVVANSTRIDPDSNSAYGSWGNQLTRGGYLETVAPSTTTNPLMGCPQQLSQYPQSMDHLDTSGYYTYAMNMRVGHNPNTGLAVGQHGARTTLDFVSPSRSALIMNGIWNGAAFSRTSNEGTYVSGMRAAGNLVPFDDSVLILYAGGNVSLTKLDAIPTEKTSPAGIDFWLGGVVR